jgi:hypothetical protein
MASNGILARHYHGSSSTNCQAPLLVKVDFLHGPLVNCNLYW